MLKGELDWIVMKALSKDRALRYESATALSDDLERHLNQIPVMAGPPTASYRFKKFATRNRSWLAGAALVTILLIGSTALSLFQWNQLRVALRNETTAVANAQSALDRELALSDFLLDGIIQSANPQKGDREITVRNAILAREAEIPQLFGDDRLLKAWVQNRVGKYLLAISSYQEALRNLKESFSTQVSILGLENEETLDTGTALTRAYSSLEQHAEAIEMAELILKSKRQIFGPEDPKTLSAMLNLGNRYYQNGQLEQAESVLSETEALSESAGLDSTFVHSLNSLASVNFHRGEFDDAEVLWNKALNRMEDIGSVGFEPENPNKFQTTKSLIRSNLARLYLARGSFSEALTCLNEVVQIQSGLLGDEHSDTLKTRRQLAIAYSMLGKHEDAIKQFRLVFETYRKQFGMEHGRTQDAVENLIIALNRDHRYEESCQLAEEFLAELTRQLKPDPWKIIKNRRSLASALKGMGRFQEAAEIETLILEAIEQRAVELEEGSPQALDNQIQWGGVLCNAGNTRAALRRYEEAITFYTDAIELLRQVEGGDPTHVANSYLINCLYGRSKAYRHTSQLDGALSDIKQALSRCTGQPQREATLDAEFAKTLAASGEIRQANEMCGRILQEWPDDPEVVLKAAECFAVMAANSVEKSRGESQSTTDGQPPPAIRAITLLKRSIELGRLKNGRSPQTLDSNPDWDTLRHQSDFKELRSMLSTPSLNR